MDALRRIPTEIPDFFRAIQITGSEQLAFSEVPSRLRLWSEANPNSIGAHALIHRHLDALRALSVTLQTNNKNLFLYRCDTIPFQFARRDNDLVLLVNGIDAAVNINTIQAPDTRQRAHIAAERIIAPCMHAIYDTFKNSDIGFFGVVVHYASSNFLEKTESLELESVAVIVPKLQCERYATGRITFDELLRSSDCYVSDRNTMRLSKVALP